MEAPLLAVRRERDVLRDPGLQRAHVLALDAGEPVVLEPPRSLLGRARARQRQHRTMLERDVAWMLVEALVGDVAGAEQLGAALRVDD